MTAYTSMQERAAQISGLGVFGKIRKECEADIVIGIPTYNNARTIARTMLMLQTGLACYYPDLKAVIVAADRGSKDGTTAIMRNSVVRKIPVFISRASRETDLVQRDPYYSLPARADAIQAIFQTAEELDARACAILDAEITSITPAWVDQLLRPVLECGFDHVSPLYPFSRQDNLITNTILYPLVRAVYGKQVRQPMAGNFCVSGRLARFHLQKMTDEAGRALYGVDVRPMSQAIANDFRLVQVYLGPRVRDSAGKPGLHTVLPWIMEAVFAIVESDHPLWKPIRGSRSVPIVGSESGTVAEQARVDIDAMLALFRQAVRDLKSVWTDILGPVDFSLLEYTAFRSEGRFTITPTFWARIMYSCIIAYHKRTVSRGHLLQSLPPLYLGFAASYLLALLDKGPQETEKEIERICLAFETAKPHLVRNWGR